VILTILVIFAIFWSVRGKPTYIAGVSAWTLGVLWLAAGSVFLAFQSQIRIYFEKFNRLSALQGQGWSYPAAATQSIQYPPTDITNAVFGSQLNF
jgi:hypothetical protein